MKQPKIAVFSGSSRSGSINMQLAHAAARMAQEMGAHVTFIDLEKDYPMPLFDPDMMQEKGLPQQAVKLKELLAKQDALIVACPEYNSSITPLLKNAIDWSSRPHEEGEAMCRATTGKVVGLLATSPGALGGLRGLSHMRDIFSNIGALVVPSMAAVGGGFEAFDENGHLKAPQHATMVRKVVDDVVHTARALINA